MNEKAQIELRGCIAGYGSFGSALMMKLASTCGCRVHASEEYQYSSDWRGVVWEADPYEFMRPVHGYDVHGGSKYMPSTNNMSCY